MSVPGIQVDCLTVGPFQENSYFLRRRGEPETILIDPGDEADRLCEVLDRHALLPVAILNTHAHLDHIGAVSALKERYGIPFRLHAAELDILRGAPDAARLFGVDVPPVPEVDAPLAHLERIQLAGLSLEVRHTPGHSPGHVCLVVPGAVFAGDALFYGSIGRTDLPGGDTQTLLDSIARHLLSLPDPTLVYSGHGPVTTIGRERRQNPFLLGLAKSSGGEADLGQEGRPG
jgi:glyoxylase-like metal-dependent hydrolase (beta-lactamase superfamily II)